jgi:O-antigen ligase
MELASIAGQMVSQKFWIGEGLNTFTIKETKFIGIKSYEWILQPVHNIYLLAFSETGIIGLIFLLFVFYKAFKNAFSKKKISLLVTIVFILITGLFDHYWLTLQQNLLLFGFVVGLSI